MLTTARLIQRAWGDFNTMKYEIKHNNTLNIEALKCNYLVQKSQRPKNVLPLHIIYTVCTSHTLKS